MLVTIFCVLAIFGGNPVPQSTCFMAPLPLYQPSPATWKAQPYITPLVYLGESVTGVAPPTYYPLPGCPDQAMCRASNYQQVPSQSYVPAATVKGMPYVAPTTYGSSWSSAVVPARGAK